MGKLINISQLSTLLNLVSSRSKKPTNYILRYWEKEFKQIKPKILNGNRRYYDQKNINLLKKVKFLLKNEGMTISGVKKLLDKKETFQLDETLNDSIRSSKIRNKLKNISDLLKDLKNYKKDG